MNLNLLSQLESFLFDPLQSEHTSIPSLSSSTPSIIMKNGTNGTALDGVGIWLNDTLLTNGTINSNHTIHGHSSHSSLQTAVVDLGYGFTAISVIMVVLRTCIRPLNHEKYKIDDYAMIGSMILLAAITATNPLVVRTSHLNSISMLRFY